MACICGKGAVILLILANYGSMNYWSSEMLLKLLMSFRSVCTYLCMRSILL